MSCQTQLATRGPLINLALFKWPQIWHKRAQSHAKWCLHHALPIWFEIFRKFMQKLKFKGSIWETSMDRSKIAFQHHVKHVMVWWMQILKFKGSICETSMDRIKIAFYHHVKHVMVWWYITLWPQNTIWTPPKKFHTLFTNNSSQTVVWPKLPKYITN